MARQGGTSRRRVGNDGGSGAVGARGEPGAGAEVEAEGEREAEAEVEEGAGGVPLTESQWISQTHTPADLTMAPAPMKNFQFGSPVLGLSVSGEIM